MVRFTVDNRNRLIFYGNPVGYVKADTSDLEQIYTICRDAPPPGYQGYRMALSDVVELYDDSGSEFYYCDRVGFQPIRFEQKQDPCINMTL